MRQYWQIFKEKLVLYVLPQTFDEKRFQEYICKMNLKVHIHALF